MARFDKNVDFEIVPIARPPPENSAAPPPAPNINNSTVGVGGDATEIFTVDLSSTATSKIAPAPPPPASKSSCPTCAENIEKAKFLMNYLDQTDQVLNLKIQLEKERDQLNRLLEEKNTYIEALKKEEANLNFKLVKTLEDRDVCRKQVIDLHKKSDEISKQKNAADIEAMSFKSCKDQLQHLVDELKQDKKYLQEKLDEKSKELGSFQQQKNSINVENNLNSKEMKRLSACLKKCLEISKKIKRYERKGQNRISIKKFSKYLKKLNENAKFLPDDFLGTFSFSSSSASSSESENDESLSNISRETPSTSTEIADEKSKKRRPPLKKPSPPPPTQTGAVKKLQNAWQNAQSAKPLPFKKPNEASLKEKNVVGVGKISADGKKVSADDKKVSVNSEKISADVKKNSADVKKISVDRKKISVDGKSSASWVVDVKVSWSEMKRKIFLNSKLSPIKEKNLEKIFTEKTKLDDDSNLNIEENLFQILENLEKNDENTKVLDEATKLDHQTQPEDNQITKLNTSFELEDNLMIVDESEPQNETSIENQPLVDKPPEMENKEKINLLSTKRKKNWIENEEKSKKFCPMTSKKARISSDSKENSIEKGSPICCAEPIPDKKCPSRIRQHFLSVLDTLLCKENSTIINLGVEKWSINKNLASSTNANFSPTDNQAILKAFKNLEDKLEKLTPQILVKCLLENCLQKCCCCLVGCQWKKSTILNLNFNFHQNAPFLSSNEKKIFQLLDMLFEARTPWLKPTCELMIEQLKLKIFKNNNQNNQQIFETNFRWFYYFAWKIGNFKILGRFFYDLIFFLDDFRQQDLTTAFLSLASVWPEAFLRCIFDEKCHQMTDSDAEDDDEKFFFEIFRHFLRKKFQITKDAFFISKAKNLLEHFCPQSSTLKNVEKFNYLFDLDVLNGQNSNLEYFELKFKRLLKSLNSYLVMGFELDDYVKLRKMDEICQQKIPRQICHIYQGLIFSPNFLEILNNLCKFSAICDLKFVTENLLDQFLDEIYPGNFDQKFNNFLIRLLILGQLCKISKFSTLLKSRDEKLRNLIGRGAEQFLTPPTLHHEKTPILQYVIYAFSLQYAPICRRVRKIADDFFSTMVAQDDKNANLRFLKLFYEKLCKV